MRYFDFFFVNLHHDKVESTNLCHDVAYPCGNIASMGRVYTASTV